MSPALNMESRLPRRDKVFAWDMHYSCNFRCPYCFCLESGWTEMAKKSRYKSAKVLESVWKRIHGLYGRCQLRVTAGEPFTYPGFVDVVLAVSRWHDMQITSNCSQAEALRSLAREADPSRVELDCTFHPLHMDLEVFVENVLLLRRAGFTANVCCLAYPPLLDRLSGIKERFAGAGVYMNLAVYWGAWEGRRYPFDYTPRERDALRAIVGSDKGLELVNLDPIPIRGKVCGAGQRYAVIHADGRVYRCGQLCGEGQSIGDIFDEGFRLSSAALPCETEYCRCKELQSAWEEGDRDGFMERASRARD